MSSQAKSLQTDPVHKCWNLANCGQFTSTTILQTSLIRKYQNLENWFTSSQAPTSCKQSSIHKCQHLVNRLSLHKCQILANCCQFTSDCCKFRSAKTLQTAANSHHHPQHKSKICNLNHPPKITPMLQATASPSSSSSLWQLTLHVNKWKTLRT